MIHPDTEKEILELKAKLNMWKDALSIYKATGRSNYFNAVDIQTTKNCLKIAESVAIADTIQTYKEMLKELIVNINGGGSTDAYQIMMDYAIDYGDVLTPIEVEFKEKYGSALNAKTKS